MLAEHQPSHSNLAGAIDTVYTEGKCDAAEEGAISNAISRQYRLMHKTLASSTKTRSMEGTTHALRGRDELCVINRAGTIHRRKEQTTNNSPGSRDQYSTYDRIDPTKKETIQAEVGAMSPRKELIQEEAGAIHDKIGALHHWEGAIHAEEGAIIAKAGSMHAREGADHAMVGAIDCAEVKIEA